MAAQVTIRLAHHGVEIRCPSAGISEDRPFREKVEQALFESLSARYHELTRNRASKSDLLAIGQELFDWLNGSDSALRRLLDSVEPPLLIEFATGRADNAAARAFLDAPWELLADSGQHWALASGFIYCPIRRIGTALEPPARASPDSLSLVFMAAAPAGADNLDYEAEESSILQATQQLGLDIVVEESGALSRLSAVVAREEPDVVQISCHGTLEPTPCLLLEDDIGDPHMVDASTLVSRLAAHKPRLLFLSACETGQSDPLLDSLARSLVHSGAPAVMGWAAPVLDNEAALFAAYLYERLVAGDDLAHALAYARLDLAFSDKLKEPARDWHLARLYFSSHGGGALATAGGPRKFLNRGKAVKTFLNTKDSQVPVAGELEFVGRRRQIQRILREFRATNNAGVLIHGMGRQGKSSLAARVAQRLEPTHDTVVLFGRYDAPAILSQFRSVLSSPEVASIVEGYLPLVGDPKQLLPALNELLTGPCAQNDPSKKSRPVLLVIDDFEQALDERASGPHTLKPAYLESMRAVITAFGNASTQSRLLFTSRYRFTLPEAGTDLAGRLLDLPLPGMSRRESHKQAFAKLRLHSTRITADDLEELTGLLGRMVTSAQGNPGLQNLVFSLFLEDPDSSKRCLDQLDEFRATGAQPTEAALQEFLENLTIETLLGLLQPAERELLRSMLMFEIPVPESVIGLLSERSSAPGAQERIARLTSLGLVEAYEDSHEGAEPDLAINALVRPLAGALGAEKRVELAGLVALPLFETWGGEESGPSRHSLQDYELTGLALLADDSRIAAAAAARALRLLDNRFEYRQAADWATRSVALLDSARFPTSVDLLRTAAERCQEVGEASTALAFLERAVAAITAAPEATDAVHRGATLVTYARALVQRGQPSEALPALEQALDLLEGDRERAIVLGEIAEIRAQKGEVDEALELHQQELEVYEGLGDTRSRAVTLGEIATIRAEKGEVDEALKLQEERLEVNEGLGDKDGIAAALWAIAQIDLQQQRFREAYERLDQSYRIYLEIGRLEGICHVGLSLGQLVCGGGHSEDGLAVLTRSRDGFVQLGQPDNARQAQAIIDHFSQGESPPESKAAAP